MQPDIRVKNIYEPPDTQDGLRVLTDRLWPRGLSKEKAAIDLWAKELAPGTALRKWYGHDPELWAEFKVKYLAELRQNTHVAPFVAAQAGCVVLTLLFSARDSEHVHTLVLQSFLQEQFRKGCV